MLRLTLGYPSGDPRLAAAARTIQRQLGVDRHRGRSAAGRLRPTWSTRGSRPGPSISRCVTVPRGISDAASAASAFGCPISDALGDRLDRHDAPAPTTGRRPAGRRAGSPIATEPSPPSTPATATSTQPDAGPARLPLLATGNLSGYCEPSASGISLVDAISGRGAGRRGRPGTVGGPAGAAADPAIVDLRRVRCTALGDSTTRTRRMGVDRSAQRVVRLAGGLIVARFKWSVSGAINADRDRAVVNLRITISRRRVLRFGRCS